MCQSMNISDLPPGLQDPPLLLASFAPSGELIVAGTDDKSTEVTVQQSTTGGGGLRLLWLHFPLQVLVWPKIKTTHSLPAKPLLRFDGGKASTSLTPPATVLASLISWLIGYCHRPSPQGGPCCIYSLAVSPVATPPLLAVSVQPGTLFKAAGNKEIHLWDYTTGGHLRTLDVGEH